MSETVLVVDTAIGQREEVVCHEKPLTFQDAIDIAKGCFDFAGGYHDDRLEVFHHGIQTVINALERAGKTGMSEYGIRVLASIGRGE